MENLQNEQTQPKQELSVEEQIALAVEKTNAEWEAKFNAKVNEIAKSTRERYAKEAEKEKMSAEERAKVEYEERINTLTEELNAHKTEIKTRKINEAILQNELPQYYKNDVRLINADDTNFDKVIKSIKSEHNEYLKSVLNKGVKSTAPDSSGTQTSGNSTQKSILAKVGVRI